MSTARLSRKVLTRWNWPMNLVFSVKQQQQVGARVWRWSGEGWAWLRLEQDEDA
jgi:hypothetical protein